MPAPQTGSNAQHVVLVTGASRGIGLELVRQYAASDASSPSSTLVIAAVRDPAKADAVHALAAQHPDSVRVVQLDSADDASIAGAVEAVRRLTDHVDVLINNAGVLSAGPDAILKATRADLLQVQSINVAGPLAVLQAFLPLLTASTSTPRIANISSNIGSNAAGRDYGAHFIAYGASKAALNYVTSAASVALKDQAIVLAINPGWVQTDMGRSAGSPPLTPAQSVDGVRRVIAGATLADSGRFLDYTGDALAF